MDLFVVLFATAMALYGFWYGAFAREFAARYPWTGRVKHRYKPVSGNESWSLLFR
jgi:hypothetical protein